MQQTPGVDELPVDTRAVVEVVPNVDGQQERQRQYLLNHTETSSQLGANGMNSRVVTLLFSEEVSLDEDESEQSVELDESAVEATQP